MSGPNPFSTADASQHNLISKIVGSGPYHVVVDLVDIDTAYAAQLGSAADPVQQEYVTQIGTAANPVDSIYVKHIYPPPSVIQDAIGGTGIQIDYPIAGPTISALIAAGNGIAVNVDENRVINLSTTLSLLNGPGIQITPFTDEGTPNGYIISATGGGPVPGPDTGITAGEIAIGNGGAGLTSSANVVFDNTSQLLYVPGTIVNTPDEAGVLRLTTGGPAGNAYIESGFEDAPHAGNMLNISYVGGTTDPTVAIDTYESFVGINKSGPTAALDVVGQAVIAYDAGHGADPTVYTTIAYGPAGNATLLASTTYVMYVWGAGGAANGGVGGGGGYAEYEITPGANTTLSWTGSYGGATGGGNALVGTIGTSTFIVPGGGAGGISGGTGGGGGETLGGQPNPPGGRLGGSGLAAIATYVDTRAWRYTTSGGTIGGTGDVFNEGTIDGLTATLGGSVVVNLANPPVNVSINIPTPGVTYTIAAGTTMTFVTNNTVFNGATFSSPAGAVFQLTQVTGYAVNDGTELASTTNTSVSLYADWPNTPTPTFPGGSVDTGLTGITYSPGNVTCSGVITYVPGTTFYLFFSAATDDTTGQIITAPSGAAMTISSPFDFLTGVTLTTTGTGNLPTGSQIDVASRQFNNTGAVSATYTGAPYGGGGGIGGGSPALVAGVTGMTYGTSRNEFAGGGGGNYQYNSSLTVNQVAPGVGNRSYINKFNKTGAYGAGGTGGNVGGTHYLLLQTKTNTGVFPPALTVYGDEVVSGTLYAGSAGITGTLSAGSAGITGTLSAGSAGITGQLTTGSFQTSGTFNAFGGTFSDVLTYKGNAITPEYQYTVPAYSESNRDGIRFPAATGSYTPGVYIMFYHSADPSLPSNSAITVYPSVATGFYGYSNPDDNYVRIIGESGALIFHNKTANPVTYDITVFKLCSL